MKLIDLLDRAVSFHRPLVKVTGSVCSALMLSQAIYWTRRTKNEDGWFYKTQQEWEDETGLSRWEQEGARKALKKAGVWEEKNERLNHRMWYRIKEEPLCRMLESLTAECGKTTLGNAENPHPSNKAENTSENTSREHGQLFEDEKPSPSTPPKKPRKGSGKATVEEVVSYCVSELKMTAKDGESMFLYFESNEWPKNWQAACRRWKLEGWMSSQKQAKNERLGIRANSEPAPCYDLQRQRDIIDERVKRDREMARYESED